MNQYKFTKKKIIEKLMSFSHQSNKNKHKNLLDLTALTNNLNS